jgi:rhomboid protease GluP
MECAVAETARVATVGAMSSPEVSADPAGEPAPENLVAVGTYPTFSAGSERGLVVLAMGLPYWLEPAGDAFVLLVEAPTHAAVREQLARFERESVGWPPAPLRVGGALRAVDLVLAMAWAVTLFGAFWASIRWPQIVATGALDAHAVIARHEMWRPFTALFLHADSGHLVSNALGGILVFSATTATLGARRGWLLIVIAAAIGNLLSAAVQYPEAYRSIGASTALFAGLGLLTGHACAHALRAERRRWRALFVPLAAGATVLALHGAGGVRVDLGAHVCGFGVGLALGFLTGAMRNLGRTTAQSVLR